jgi:hypothetical protein
MLQLFATVSTTPSVLVAKFDSVVDTSGKPSLANISANFRKNLNDPNGKKPDAKNLSIRKLAKI